MKAVASSVGSGVVVSSEEGGVTKERTTAEKVVGTARQSGIRAWQRSASAAVEAQMSRLPVSKER